MVLELKILFDRKNIQVPYERIYSYLAHKQSVRAKRYLSKIPYFLSLRKKQSYSKCEVSYMRIEIRGLGLYSSIQITSFYVLTYKVVIVCTLCANMQGAR